jgi:hypothetical protein
MHGRWRVGDEVFVKFRVSRSEQQPPDARLAPSLRISRAHPPSLRTEDVQNSKMEILLFCFGSRDNTMLRRIKHFFLFRLNDDFLFHL